jgi:hypothetical protein
MHYDPNQPSQPLQQLYQLRLVALIGSYASSILLANLYEQHQIGMDSEHSETTPLEW